MCFMDKDSFIVYIKIDIYSDIADDVGTMFDTSNYKWNRPLRKGKNKEVIWCNERWIWLKNREKVYWIKSKNL